MPQTNLTDTVIIANVTMSREAAEAVEQLTNYEQVVQEDLAARAAGLTSEDLLAHCLDGVEDERTVTAWQEYVDAIYAH